MNPEDIQQRLLSIQSLLSFKEKLHLLIFLLEKNPTILKKISPTKVKFVMKKSTIFFKKGIRDSLNKKLQNSMTKKQKDRNFFRRKILGRENTIKCFLKEN